MKNIERIERQKEGGDRTRQGWSEDDRYNIELYTRLNEEYGKDFRSMNWGSRASQERRFEVLAELVQLEGRSLLDVGCGQGDLFGWLRRRKLAVEYTGLDITPAMVERARQAYPDTRFVVGELENAALLPHDIVFASGVFCHRKNNPVRFMEDFICGMWRLARTTVVFNSLSSWATKKDEGEFCADPSDVLRFCGELTPGVVLRHDYHPGDFTVFLYKESAG